MSPKRSISALLVTLTKATGRASITGIKTTVKNEATANPWNTMKPRKATITKIMLEGYGNWILSNTR